MNCTYKQMWTVYSDSFFIRFPELMSSLHEFSSRKNCMYSKKKIIEDYFLFTLFNPDEFVSFVKPWL